MANGREAVVIKIGGSTLDAEYESESPVIRGLVEPLQALLRTYDVYVTPGGGPAWDVRKKWRRRYGTSPQDFEFLARYNLLLNARELASAFGRNARVCEPQDFKPADFSAEEKIEVIQICYWAPDHLMRKYNQDPAYSDVQTLVMAEELAAFYSRVFVVFAKRTKGIFRCDPRLDRDKISKILVSKETSRQKREKYLTILDIMDQYEADGAEFNKVRLPEVTTSQFLGGEIIRMGEDGEDDHLIEQPAIEFLDEAKHVVDRLGVVHYSRIDLIRDMVTAPKRDSPYSFIIRG
jgi:hypothetical protein